MAKYGRAARHRPAPAHLRPHLDPRPTAPGDTAAELETAPPPQPVPGRLRAPLASPAARPCGWRAGGLPKGEAPEISGLPGPAPLPPTTLRPCTQRPTDCKVGKKGERGQRSNGLCPLPIYPTKQPGHTRQRSARGNWSPRRGGLRGRGILSGMRGGQTQDATPWILDTSHFSCVTSWDPQVLQSSSHTDAPTWGLKAGGCAQERL